MPLNDHFYNGHGPAYTGLVSESGPAGFGKFINQGWMELVWTDLQGEPFWQGVSLYAVAGKVKH
jgi:hypothetical protein